MLKTILTDSKTISMKTILIIVLVVIQTQNFAQSSGSIAGKIIDKNTNEELIGANVLIEGTTIGASTDIDGKYIIKGLSEGNYTIKVSYISYQTITVKDVNVQSGVMAKLDVSLESTSTELQEVLVTAEALKNTETSVLKIQKNSANIVDGFSGELIKKNNSSDGTDVLKRMTGVTISEGKYAFVRGVGDRYNNTLLNGASLPSTDPEKKSFSYDIFPANLIESVITSKTFTPDKPADFTGGLVQISTVEFPNKFTSEVSISSGINTATSFKDYLTYSGGKTDYLGIDDGTRNYPGTIGSEKVVKGNLTDAQMTEVAKSFANNWKTSDSKAPVNGGFKITAGDKYDLSADQIFGYVGSFSYNNSFTSTEKQKSLYDDEGKRYNYKGFDYNSSLMWSGMLNLSYKFGLTNKISLKNVFNQNADNETNTRNGYYRYSGQNRDITSLRFVSRSLLSSQLIGEHKFDLLNGLNFDWAFSFSRSDRNEPDARRYVYWSDPEDASIPKQLLLDQSVTTRYYGDLVDNDYNGIVNLEIKPFENPDLPKLKVGALYNKKDREFDARTFGFKNLIGGSYSQEQQILSLPIDQIFVSENINNTFIGVEEVTKPSDSYNSNQKIGAGYLMLDAKVIDEIRFVGGARFEYSNQILNSNISKDSIINVNESYNDLLPSLNLTYFINDEMNLRLAYSNTLARPEFRELAPFSYFDFVANENVEGNPELKRTIIKNADVRFEYFPNTGELFAVSFFYKNFQNPIEQILKGSTGNEPTVSFTNALRANNYGVEFEVRKSLALLTEYLNGFSFVGNLSLIKSKVEFKNVSLNGETFQETERALQGQADYIFNLGLYYDNFDLGFNSSLVYNKVGSRISKVGSSDLGNIIENPVDIIDFSISKKLFSSFAIKLSVKDLLNQDRTFTQQSPIGDKISEINHTGRNISMELSYQIN